MTRHAARWVLLMLAWVFIHAEALATSTDSSLAGTVLQVENVEQYTYLLLQTTDGETWAAVQRASVPVGARVEIADVAVMHDFTSPTLHRTFDRIVFGQLAQNAAEGQMQDIAGTHARLGKSSPTSVVNVTKADAPNAFTVAELATEVADLDGRAVTIRGQVVKFTPEVLGHNWIHLRDGSGSANDGSNDVLVVTTDSAAVGDVVVAKGTVRTDRDLGSGYRYKLLIEDATLHK